MMNYLKAIFELFRDAGIKWGQDKASMLAAGLAYYTIFSLAPLLVLSVAIASRILRETSVQEVIISLVAENVGSEIAVYVSDILSNATISTSSSAIISTIVGIGILFWGASGVFNHLKRALNFIWGVDVEPQSGFHGILNFIQTRLLAILMVLGIGFLLAFSMALNTIVATLEGYLMVWSPEIANIVTKTDFLATTIMPIILFGIIYKALPDVEMSWRDVWLGALVTAILFAFGSYAIGIYLQYSNVGSAFGAASSLIVLLIWINYSAQIIFFGAEFTWVFANRYGSKMRPSDKAIAIRRQRLDDMPPKEIEPVSLPVNFFEPEQPKVESKSAQHAKQAAFGLFGLAMGLFLGFLGSLRKN